MNGPLLYPRLTAAEASRIVNERIAERNFEPRTEVDLHHVIFGTTGGTRADAAFLSRLGEQVRAVAGECGFPDVSSREARAYFDLRLSETLHAEMRISPNEAAKDGVWSWMAAVLLPDLVAWRWPGSSPTALAKRFYGKGRGVRNTFGRLWWRAEILKCSGDTPYALLAELGEDQIVAITERPLLAGNRRLAVTIASLWSAAVKELPQSRHEGLMRDMMKRIIRLAPLIAFDALPNDGLRAACVRVLLESVQAIGSNVEVMPSEWPAVSSPVPNPIPQRPSVWSSPVEASDTADSGDYPAQHPPAILERPDVDEEAPFSDEGEALASEDEDEDEDEGDDASFDEQDDDVMEEPGTVPVSLDAIDDHGFMVAIRQVVTEWEPVERQELMRHVCRYLGFQRLGARIRKKLSGRLNAARRRQIIDVDSDGNVVRGTRRIVDYGTQNLIRFFLSNMRAGVTYEREEALRLVAGYLGFGRLTASVETPLRNALAQGLRQGDLEAVGPHHIRRS